MTNSQQLRDVQPVAKRDAWKNLSVSQEISIDLPAPKGERVLTVSTYKGSRGLITVASVSVQYVGGSTHAIGFGVCGDFSKRIAFGDGRATEKALRTQQATALLSDIGLNIVEQARAWYEAGLDIHPADRAKRMAERALAAVQS